MLYPIKVVDIELSKPIPTIEGLDSYMGLQALVRLHGVPLGCVKASVSLGRCTSETLSKLILKQLSSEIIQQLLINGLASPTPLRSMSLATLVDLPPADLSSAAEAYTWPLVTVAVCTRDRSEDLKRCLSAIDRLDYPQLDVLVVDNAPTTEATRTLVEAYFPHVRYVREPRPGLDWARNRAILEAKGEIIAYTDDDVVVDKGWVKAIAFTFAEHSNIMAVTGLVAPYELETEAQVLFEKHGGFGRGFEPKRYQGHSNGQLPWQWLGAGQFGTGANMAYRRSVFDKIGYFDPALDVGTATSGGGDLEMFIRVLHAGYILAYEPEVLIYHRHRREYAQLKRQLSCNGSLCALWYCVATRYPGQLWSCLKVSAWWTMHWHVRRWIIASLHQTQFPKDLVVAEFSGFFSGLRTYQKANQQVKQIVQEYGHQTTVPLPVHNHFVDNLTDHGHINHNHTNQHSRPSATPEGVAVHMIELTEPLTTITHLKDYSAVKIFVAWHNHPIGSIDYTHGHSNISARTLSRLIVDKLKDNLLQIEGDSKEIALVKAKAILAERYFPKNKTIEPVSLPDDIPVSVVIATFDRPEDLRNCLIRVSAQHTQRKVEIVVVDNHPSSGLTSPVVQDFPEVVLVEEPRQGLAYARNAGFAHSSGDICIATDDDVTVPPHWIETLLKPFARPEVMITTGNVLPIELANQYQQAFENYGGLGKGFKNLEADGDWYDLSAYQVSPTWDLGATANAAFRAEIFTHPDIGLMDECLGPGMPSGVGEDTYLFYKVLKAGYSLVYTPDAYVWHRHRNTKAALKKQIYGYSKGHISYNLTTWLQDSDWRGLFHCLIDIPYWHCRRIKDVLLRRSDYPLSLILLEIWGNLAAPWSLWRSHARVKREGRSALPAKRIIAKTPAEALAK